MCNTEAGYIKLFRSMTEWEWYSDTNTCRIFLHLLLTANWKDGRFLGHEVGAGTTVISVQHLADETGLSVRNVRTAIEHLESTGEIRLKATNKFTMITIVNWAKFQREEQSDDKQPTNKRQTGDNNQRKKEEKESKNNKAEIVETDDPFEMCMNRFKEHRKKMNKPLTTYAEEQLRKKLMHLSNDKNEQMQILEQSIENCWQGVFALNGKKKGANKNYEMRSITNEQFDSMFLDLDN